MADKIAFAADIVFYPGETKPQAPARVTSPNSAYVVRNPYTKALLWLRPMDVVNVVNGVAAILLEANQSGRFPTSPAKRGRREYINPLTGNTFQIPSSYIIKEPHQ